MSLAPESKEKILEAIPFLPDLKLGRISKVYDGDSYWFTCYLSGDSKLYRFPLRLRGVDTPELRTKCTEEKKLAISARDFVSSLILNKIVEVKNIAREKYGRILCDIFVDGKSLCDLVIESGHGRRYYGGKRAKWI